MGSTDRHLRFRMVADSEISDTKFVYGLFPHLLVWIFPVCKTLYI